eukprot:4193392-Prymnesium_polylepis.1
MDDGRLRGRRREGVAARMRIALSAISRRRILPPRHVYLGDVYLPWACARQSDSPPFLHASCLCLTHRPGETC